MSQGKRSKSAAKGTIALAAVVGMVALAPAVEAAELNQRVAIGVFRGPQAGRVQDAVESALLRRYFLVPESAVVDAARKAGLRLQSPQDFAQVARSLNLQAFVTATVRKQRIWTVQMVVRKGDTGQAVGRFDWKDRHLDNLAAALARTTPRRLAVLLQSGAGRPAAPSTVDDLLAGAAPAENEPSTRKAPSLPEREERTSRHERAEREDKASSLERAEREDKASSEEAERPAPRKERPVRLAKAERIERGSKAERVDAEETERAAPAKGKDSDRADEFESDPASTPRPFFELGVGGRVFSRTMSYADNYSGLPGYKLSRASALSLDAAFHPFALAPSTAGSWVRGLGLTGAFNYAMGIGTQGGGTAGATRTEVFGYEVGVRQRFTAGMFDVIPHVGYLLDQFMATNAERSPDVRYQVVRVGLGGQLNISANAAVRASVDYLDVLNPGPMADMFPHATVRGMDLTLGVGWAFTDSLELQAAVGWKRYGFDMHAEEGDDNIAGGAVDEYLSMTFGFAYRPVLGRR
jgi:hypothetical protein